MGRELANAAKGAQREGVKRIRYKKIENEKKYKKIRKAQKQAKMENQLTSTTTACEMKI